MMDDPEHARPRRMASGAFSVKRVNAMRPATQRIVDAQIDALLAGPRPVDLVEAFALPVPSLVISDLLGVPYENHDFFQRNSRIIINRDSTDEQRGGAVFQLAGYLDELMGAKLASPTRWPCWNTPTSWLVCATPATRRWWLRRWTSCCAT
jgi:cytochrome P450